jgi:mRNA interferase MazF
LPKESWIKISQIRTLAVERLGDLLGRLAPEELEEIMNGLLELIG